MDVKKHLRMFVMLVIAVFSVIFVFLFVSMFFVIKMLIDDGGIYALNAGDMIGHLLIMLFSAGIIYFSLKISCRFKAADSTG